MASSMWRMNGLCGSMAGVLLLYTLLFSSEVMGQDPETVPPDSTHVSDTGAGTTLDVTPTTAPRISTTSVRGNLTPDNDVANSSIHNASGSVVPKHIVPDIKCVGKEDISEQTAIKAEVQTDDCEATKRVIQENAAIWCSSDNCNLNIFQDGKTVLVASNDVKRSTVTEALQSENLKKGLGLTKIETPQSSGSSVFVGILVSGLLVAIGIIVWYFKCQRKPDAKGASLAEKAFPVDQDNQGNTLVSEAPLHPPPETQEKPNVNGESPEADKTPTPPPTNGHSTAKTADTEL